MRPVLYIMMIGIACCMTQSTVCAQAGRPLDVAPNVGADVAYTDVYIDDSFEASDAIARATALTERGRWGDAAEELQRIADTAGHKLVRTSSGGFINIRDHVNAIIASWPTVGATAYRELYDRQIERSLEQLDRRTSLRNLLSVFDRFFCTTGAARIADTIGQRAIEAGDLALARHVYERVLNDHPDASKYQTPYRAMISLIAAMSGSVKPTNNESDENATIRWMGQDRTLADIRESLSANFPALTVAPSPTDWPMLAGNDERDRIATTTVDDLGLLWRFDRAASDETHAEPETAPVDRDTNRDDARLLTALPSVDGDFIYLQLSRSVVALHRSTGTVAWRFEAGVGESETTGYMEDPPLSLDAVTIADGRVYASLPGDAVSYYSYESARSPAELACLDAHTGNVIWRLDQHAIEERFAEVAFDTSPLVRHGSLYIVGRRRRSFGFEDCYLYRFSAATGVFEWRTHLGSASTGTFGSRRPTRAIPAMHGDLVYVCSNLGTISAVSAHTGRTHWLRQYPRASESEDEATSRFAREFKPWQFNPVIWSDGRIIVSPTDSSQILVLDANDGALRATLPTKKSGVAATVLGIRGDTVCVASEEIACYELSKNKPLWSTTLPANTKVFGRGAWVDDVLMMPTRTGMSTFSVVDGLRSDADWDTDGEGGNLIVLRDSILVAGPDRLSMYVRRRDIWKALRERMAEAPTDPLPALELAEVALSNGQFSEAIGVLDEAVRRAEHANSSTTELHGARLFSDAMMFADLLASRSELSLDVLDKLFLYASQFAPGTAEHLAYRLTFAKLYDRFDRPDRAMRLYHQILRDRSLRSQPVIADADGHSNAAAHAQAKIAKLIANHGRDLYEPFETEARSWLQGATENEDETTFERIVATFPNSVVAPQSLIAHGSLLAQRNRPEEAAKRFAQAYHRYPKLVGRPNLLRRIADAYESAGKPTHAYLWLTKAAREHPSVKIKHQGQSLSFLDYRKRLAHLRPLVETSRPDIALPLTAHFEKTFDGPAKLLKPKFGDDPVSRWSRYFVSAADGVHAFAAGSDEELWPTPATASGQVSLLIATADVAVFATRRELFALDLLSGNRRWSRGQAPPKDDVHLDWEKEEAFRTHTVYGQRLLSLKNSGLLTCMDLVSGEELWSRRHRPVPAGRITMNDRWVAYATHQNDETSIQLIDVGTGAWIKDITLGEKQTVNHAFVTLDGQLVVVASRAILAFDPDTGERRWRADVEGRIRSASLQVDVDALYFVDKSECLKKISLEDGHVLWTSARIGGEDDISTFLQDDSAIVTSDTSVSAIDAVTGVTQWRGVAPDHPRFVASLLTKSFAIVVDVPGGLREEESRAYFYDHRNASGVIPKDGGAPSLGKLGDVRTVLAVDGALLVQTGLTIRGWTQE